MFVQRNCFQRQTELLGEGNIRQEILSIYQISNCIVSHQYQKALDLIEDFQKTSELDEDLAYEFQLMEAHCRFHLKDIPKTQSICKKIYDELAQEQRQLLETSNASINRSQQISKSILIQQLKRTFSIRFYTFVISIMIRGQNIGIQPKEILDKLIRILKVDKCIYLPEVLGTLTGCRNFRHVHKVRTLNGPESKEKAKKLQILAIWKYLINQSSQCIQFKKEALSIWKNQNCLKQKQKCEEELKELLQNESANKAKGKFMRTLANTYMFVHKLRDLENQFKEVPENINFKLTLSMLFKSLKAQDLDKASENINLSHSKFVNLNDKKNLLTSIISKSEEFYQNYRRQKNNEITGLIYNSKFVDNQKLQINRKFMAFCQKIRKHAFKIAFPYVKECALVRYKKQSKMRKIQ